MIVAFSRVHYGLDYLHYVMRSALPFVDKFVVLYTPTPSAGFQWSTTPCPDKRDELHNLALSTAGDKLNWIEGLPISAHTVFACYPQAELVLELDADEIIDGLLFEQILSLHHAGRLSLWNYTVPFYHHWRSFNHVCYGGDSARLYLPHNRQSAYGGLESPAGGIHHMGYARTVENMRYKWELSVHRPELRADWWDKFLSWTPEGGPHTDVHPVMINYWNVVPYDKADFPPFMKEHPYFDTEIIA